jgi:hypothetical protein
VVGEFFLIIFVGVSMTSFQEKIKKVESKLFLSSISASELLFFRRLQDKNPFFKRVFE